MSKRTNANAYFYWGLLFLCIQLLVVIRNILSGYLTFFWYCDFTPGLFALFFFLKNEQAIKGILSIGLIGQLTYSALLLYKIIFGISLFGYIFDFQNNFELISTLILHFATLFVIIATYRVKVTYKSLIYSFTFLTILYLSVLLFTAPNYEINGNYNFIYYSDSLSPHLQYYTSLWIVLAFTLIVLPTYYLQMLLYWFSYGRKIN